MFPPPSPASSWLITKLKQSPRPKYNRFNMIKLTAFHQSQTISPWLPSRPYNTIQPILPICALFFFSPLSLSTLDWTVNYTSGYAIVVCHVIYSPMITIAWATTRIVRSSGWHWRHCKRICIRQLVIFGVLACCCGNWPRWLWCHSKRSIHLSWPLICVTAIGWVSQSIAPMNCKKSGILIL